LTNRHDQALALALIAPRAGRRADQARVHDCVGDLGAPARLEVRQQLEPAGVVARWCIKQSGTTQSG
jgi:hypothetical protein